MPVLSVVQVTINDSSLMCLKMILGALGINIIFNISITIRNLYNFIKRRKNKIQQEAFNATTIENIAIYKEKDI